MLSCAYQPSKKLVGLQYLSLLIWNRNKDKPSHNIDSFKNMFIVFLTI